MADPLGFSNLPTQQVGQGGVPIQPVSLYPPPPVQEQPQVVDRVAYLTEQRQQAEQAQQLADELQRQQNAEFQRKVEALRSAQFQQGTQQMIDEAIGQGQRGLAGALNEKLNSPPQPAPYTNPGSLAYAEQMQHADPSFAVSPDRRVGGNALQAAIEAARTDIPYADRAAEIAGKLGTYAGQGAANTILGPVGLAQPLLPDALQPQNIAGKAVGFAAETAVPTEVWQAAIELIPGVGNGPELLRGVKGAMPELEGMAARAGMRVEEYVAERQGKEALSALLEKRGIKPISGASDELANIPPETTASAGIQPIAKKMRDMIATARKLGPEQARMISEQKSGRVLGAAERLEQGGGLSAFHESKSFLAGEYGKPTFEPLGLPAEDVNALVDHISLQTDASYFDRLGALTAIEKSTMGIKPADNELTKLEMFLPNTRIRQAFETQAMSGDIRGATRMKFPESDAGAFQPRLNESDAAYRARLAQHDAEQLASVQARHQKELEMLAAQQKRDTAAFEAQRKANLTDRGGSQSRLGEDAAALRERHAEAVRSISARHQAELDRLEAQRALDERTFAERRANPFPSDQSALPERGLPPEQTGATNTSGAAPTAGFQTRLADTINDTYVGAISAGNSPQVTGVWTRRLQAALSPLQLVKTIKTSFDIGWGGRQGWRLFPANRAEWFRMYGRQYKALVSETAFDEMQATTKAYPWFQRSQSMERPLAFLERGTGSAETSGEEYLSPITKHLPGLAGSERAYVAPGNLMRAEVLDGNIQRAVKVLNRPLNDQEFQFLIDNINNATLRGNTKWLGHANAQTLASTLFSLKGQVSGPQFALDFIRSIPPSQTISPVVRQIVAERVGAYVAAGMSTLGLAAATGFGLNKAGVPSFVSIDLNKNSKTFGTIDVGGFRWNYWGADQPLVRAAIAVAQGKEIVARGLPAQDASRVRLAKNFIGGKIAPGVPTWLWDELANSGFDNNLQTSINTPSGFAKFAGMQVAPIVGTNPVQAYRDLGPGAVIPSALLEAQGASTSTYSTAATDKQQQTSSSHTGKQSLKDAGVPFDGDQIDFRQPLLDSKPQGGAGRTNRQLIAETLGLKDVPENASLTEIRKAYISTGTTPYEKQALGDKFDTFPPIKQIISDATQSSDGWWRSHPKELKDAIDSGTIPQGEVSKAKLQILKDAGLLP